MLETTMQSVFYSRILPNSVAGAGFILVILAFRQFTKRWSKGYVRMLWILLLVQLLAPPLFQGSVYTARDLGAKISGISIARQETGGRRAEQLLQADGQTAALVSSGQPADEQAADRLGSTGISGSTDWTGNSQTAAAWQNGSGSGDTEKQADRSLLSESSQRTAAMSGRLFGAERMEVWAGVSIWAVRLWLAGIFICGGFYLYLYLRLKKRLSSAYCIYGQGYWVSEAADVPFVMPGIPPRIYLPADVTQAQRKDILAHEQQHIRNLDPLLKCAAMLAAVVYWFHPLVWIAVSLFGKDMEMYCDECVLRGKSMAQRKAYSGAMLEFASKSSGFTLTMNFAKSNTERRIHHILHVKKPRWAVRLLLAFIICISGLFFLSEKNADGQDKSNGTVQDVGQDKSSSVKQADAINKGQHKSTGTRQDAGTSTEQPAYRQDARKFARRVVRLVKDGNKKALAEMINFPIRVHLDGEETNILDEEDFISYYGQIADKNWKSAVLGADLDEMFSNYMGYSIGDGAVWFSEQIGREGYWIYAVNNSGEVQSADSPQSTRKTWEKLAVSKGMTKEEARRWYMRFAKEGKCENGLNFQFTGCAYGDYDGDGTKDVFVISSLSPHDIYPESIYPESVTETMYVYGYINEILVYEQGFEAFSQDGFQQFDVQAGINPGISCTIRFSADTDSLEEDQYLLEIGTLGYVVSQTCLTETEKVVQMLAQVPKETYHSAFSYEEYQFMLQEERGQDNVVLLQSIPGSDIRVYGYDGKEYGMRGIIADYKGTYSYFDHPWDTQYFQPELYQGDYDGDSMQEFALVYPYMYGNGISLEGLLVFEVQQDNTLSCMKMVMDNRYLEGQLGPFIQYDEADGKINIVKNGETKKVIDLTQSSDYQENKGNLVISYTSVNLYTKRSTNAIISIQEVL